MRANRGAGVALLVVVLAVVVPCSLADPSTGHGYETKSFTQAYLECLQYLNISHQSMRAYDVLDAPDAVGNCLMRCIGLSLRWWDDQVGLSEPVLLQFFRHRPDEALRQARTCQAKLDDPLATDLCGAAYNSFRCYSDALGDLLASPEYVVPSRVETRQIVRYCALVLQVSPELMADYVAAGSFLRNDKGTSLLRCVATRLGLYSDAGGVHTDRLQLLANPAGSLADAEMRLAKRCEENVRNSHADVCHVAAHSVETCYGRRAFVEIWEAAADEFGRPEPVSLVEDADPSESYATAEDEEPRAQGSDPAPDQVFFYPARKGLYKPVVVIAPLQPGVYVVPESSEEYGANSGTEPSLPDDAGNKFKPYDPGHKKVTPYDDGNKLTMDEDTADELSVDSTTPVTEDVTTDQTVEEQ